LRLERQDGCIVPAHRAEKNSLTDNVEAVSQSPVDRTLFGPEHVRRYRETGGEVGHIWNGVPTLLLTTTGRTSGEKRTAPLIYGEDGGAYVVVASKGGAPQHPAWYLNLSADPAVEV
jgi:hypothetical protein